jgi:hypothetical protein
MTLLSSVFGLAIARGPVGYNLERGTPVFGTMSMVFGRWYMFEELGLVVYTM